MKTILTVVITLFVAFVVLSCKLNTTQQKSQFSLVVADVFGMHDGRIVITGQVRNGDIKTGETIVLEKAGKELKGRIDNMEIFRKAGQHAIKDDYVGLHVSGISKFDIKKGDTLTKYTE